MNRDKPKVILCMKSPRFKLKIEAGNPCFPLGSIKKYMSTNAHIYVVVTDSQLPVYAIHFS